MTHVPGGKSHVRVQDESRMHDRATLLVILNPAIVCAVVYMGGDWACGFALPEGVSKSHSDPIGAPTEGRGGQPGLQQVELLVVKYAALQCCCSLFFRRGCFISTQRRSHFLADHILFFQHTSLLFLAAQRWKWQHDAK